jgi:iron complex transport system substrate-binding protein
VAVDRSRESDRLSDIYIAGNNPFFVEAVRLAGGVNVGKDLTMAFPVVSVEGILRMKPEVIIELGTGESIGPETKATWKDDWQSLGDGIPAVREGRVFIFSESYATVPGPRFILLIEALARRLHPDMIDRKGTIR